MIEEPLAAYFGLVNTGTSLSLFKIGTPANPNRAPFFDPLIRFTAKRHGVPKLSEAFPIAPAVGN
jgi:hypothetical protein